MVCRIKFVVSMTGVVVDDGDQCYGNVCMVGDVVDGVWCMVYGG